MSDSKPVAVPGELLAEKEFVEIAKVYGKSGDELVAFVQERMDSWRKSEAQRIDREDRAEARRERELRLQEAQEQRKVNGQSKSGRSAGGGSDDEDASYRRPYRVPAPKYDGSQDIAAYLDLFEAVMKRNEEKPESWPLLLRTAVVGTKLADSVSLEDFKAYKDLRKELLIAHGTTPVAAWKEALDAKQAGSETFRQYCLRAQRLVVRFLKLSCGADKVEAGLRPEQIVTEVTKQVVLSATSQGLSAYLLRNCKEMESLDGFAAAGTTYQSSYGGGSSKSTGRQRQQQQQSQVDRAGQRLETESSTQVFQVSVEELGRLTVPQRWDAVKKAKVCFNCLKPGHIAPSCRGKPRCDKCSRKHHSMLHEFNTTSISAYSCQMTDKAPAVRLMTAVSEVTGDKKARVRVFLDLGSEASFVSTELVKAIRPTKVGQRQLNVCSFGGDNRQKMLDMYEMKLTLTDGGSRSIRAYEVPDLGLNIPEVSPDSMARWQSRGVDLSDQVDCKVPAKPHVLLGADIANSLLISKCQFESEFVWKTELGWVLSGPTTEQATPTHATVSCVQSATVEQLWQLEEPASSTAVLPEFPIERCGNRYQVGLLWRSDRRPQSNYAQAMATAKQLVSKLNRENKRALYDDVLMREYTELRAVELDPEPQLDGYYMPHHAVFRAESTTTKTRVVFNASASQAGCESLNALLDPGPSMLPSLSGLLIRFRENPVAIQSDIRKAFFMIGVAEDDRRYLRFLWPDSSGTMQVWRLARVPFGVNCSPFLLTAVLRHHLEEAMKSAPPAEREMLQLLRDSLYVDDCVASIASAEKARQFKQVTTTCLATADMDLRKWRSNVPLGTEQAPNSGKVLGMIWNSQTDTLQVPTPTSCDEPTTKRKLLQCVASFFDPLGFVSPYVLRGKMFLQELWKLGIDWDQPVPNHLATEVLQWWGERESIRECALSRYLGCSGQASVHLFTDASERGFGCCIYTTWPGGSELIFSKAKVAPTKPETIARLELQAAFVGARWLKFVAEEMHLEVSEFHAWSDSQTTLHWIAGPPHRWKTYVANRVKEIQEVSSSLGTTWHHCPGKDNPADLVSRGATVIELKQSMWQHGPEWLPEKSKWPQQPPDESEDLVVTEIKVNAITVETTEQQSRWWSRLSSWTRLVAVASRILSWRPKNRPILSASEQREKAEALIWRMVQMELFPQEVQHLKAGQPVPSESKLHQFRPYLDSDGVMRVKGRLESSELMFSAKHPVLLAKHHVSEILLRHLHEKQLHQGVETVLACARQSYWILGDRRLARSIKQRCVTCRRYDAKTADEESGPLPSDRVQYDRPFSMCGVDYAGPLFVRGGGKAWVVLFTCGTTRAVHLDVVRSLETEEFILVYRRFCARWGEPARIRSDNGTTFRAAAKFVKARWVFNPPAAPWFGGFFERLVGVVKRPLIKVLGKALATDAELRTLLCEVESAVNNRPLTHVGDIDTEQPLTPALLCGRIWSSSVEPNAEPLSAQALRRRHLYVANLAEHLQKRWREEYLVTLSSYHSGRSTPVKQGDVVLIVSDKRRQTWRMARVTKLLPGRDSRVRVAEVQPSGGQSVMLRPVRRLLPLEVVESVPVSESAQLEQHQEELQHASSQQEVTTAAEEASPEAEPSSVEQARRTRTREIRRPARYRE